MENPSQDSIDLMVKLSAYLRNANQRARYRRKSEQARKAYMRFVIRDQDTGEPFDQKGRRAQYWYYQWCRWYALANGYPKPTKAELR